MSLHWKICTQGFTRVWTWQMQLDRMKRVKPMLRTEKVLSVTNADNMGT